jgi:hypothetical protein
MKHLVLSVLLSCAAVQAQLDFAIYYGFPSLVRENTSQTASIPLAIQIFNTYDQVVFGEGLEDPNHPDHANFVTIVAGLSNLAFGYIPLGNRPPNPATGFPGDRQLTIAQIRTRVAQWNATGVKGIFLDECGFEFGVDRQRQRDAIYEVLNPPGIPWPSVYQVWCNVWNPDDLFSPEPVTPGNPTGLPLNRNIDYLLLESYAVELGQYASPDWTYLRSKAAQWWQNHPSTAFFHIMCNTTTTPAIGFDLSLFGFHIGTVNSWVFDGVCWGEPFYSAPDSLLPWRPREQG